MAPIEGKLRLRFKHVNDLPKGKRLRMAMLGFERRPGCLHRLNFSKGRAAMGSAE